MSDRRFPIHPSDRHLLDSVPWSLVEPHAKQAASNHGGQSLERLAERQGLGLLEIAFVLLDQPWRAPKPGHAESAKADALKLINAMLQEERR